MGRKITLIRHSKSDWDHPELSDFDRPLNKRGEHDAPFMGGKLMEMNIRFDLVLASPAMRAFTTANIICSKIGYDVETIDFRPELYLAAASEMMDIIQSVDDQFRNIAIVAHNPGLTTLANVLGDRRISNVPTCGIVILEADIDRWSDLKSGCASTSDFLYPKLYQ